MTHLAGWPVTNATRWQSAFHCRVRSAWSNAFDLFPEKVTKTEERFPENWPSGGLKMKGKRYSEEQGIGILKEHEATV